ncbi:MAG: asparagine synthetase B family protein, partial [Thermoflexus sp.]
DPATLPTWLMARQTRPHVTVVLTGEGADELFQGYSWYGWPAPLPIPGFLAQPLRRLVQRWWSGRRGRHRLLALLAPDFSTLYAESVLSSVSQAEDRLAWYRPDWRGYLTAMAPRADLEDLLAESAVPFSSRMQELDLKVWLEGDPLTKADRATMLASLEARVPFLDREVVEWVARIPPRWHRKGNLGKWLLRRTFADLLPSEIVRRPKHAFETPVGAWLRGPLRPYLEKALADTSPLWRVLRPQPFKEMARQHMSDRRDFSRELWAFLHLAFWWELYG